MKLIDKPLPERQKLFAQLYVEALGARSNTKIAIDAGYPKSSAYQRAHELLNREKCPHVCRYIDEIKKDLDKEYDINKNSHLRKLMEIRETAYAKGMYGVALNAEVARGRVGGLYVDLSKSMVGNVDINSQEFKEALELSSMTREQIEQKMEELVKQNEKLENTKEIEYNPEIHDDGEDGSNS